MIYTNRDKSIHFNDLQDLHKEIPILFLFLRKFRRQSFWCFQMFEFFFVSYIQIFYVFFSLSVSVCYSEAYVLNFLQFDIHENITKMIDTHLKHIQKNLFETSP